MALLARWAEATPDKVAAHFPDIGRSLTFRELDARATRIAQWLVSLGLQDGDGIAMLMDNRPEFFELAFACRRAGIYYTPLSVHLRPAEVAYMLGDAGAKAVIVSPGVADLATAMLREGATGNVPRFAVGQGLPGYDSFEAAVTAAPDDPLPQRPVGREFLYSSGTTACPRGSSGRSWRGRTAWRPTGT